MATKTRSVFDRYNITSEDDQRQALKRTDSYQQKRPAARKVATFGKKIKKHFPKKRV